MAAFLNFLNTPSPLSQGQAHPPSSMTEGAEAMLEDMGLLL